MSRTPIPSTTSTPIRLAVVFGVRLRQARERMGISQEGLAIGAGIDEFSASARISQYETGKHVPRYEIACKLADVLKVSVAFLYAKDEATAQMLLLWQGASKLARQQALRALESPD